MSKNGAHALASAIDDAERVLEDALEYLEGEPVGTVAARGADHLNYGECFTRDFAVTAAAHLARGETAVVRNFLRALADLQAREHPLEGDRPAAGLMPASFRVSRRNGEERLRPDFGQRAIGRVAPVDAAPWWLLILRAYVRASGDRDFAREAGVREAIERILALYMAARFEMLPTLLVPDGSFMIDRRMGVHGHPLEVQALLYGAMRAARELLPEDHPMQPRLSGRLVRLRRHVCTYFWLDHERLQRLSRAGVEQFGLHVGNPFNVHPRAVPEWLEGWLAEGTGFFAGNLGPARIDCRFFTAGNLLAVTTGLAEDAQAARLLALIDARREDLWAAMPMKMLYPALEGDAWRVTTGADPKNAAWCYHNGGHWPNLIWLLASAAGRVDRWDLAESALELAAPRAHEDGWPEYYDGRRAESVGGGAQRPQTWSAAAVLAVDAMVRRREESDPFAFDADPELESRPH